MACEFTKTLNESFPSRATERLIRLNFETDGVCKIVPWIVKD